MSRVVSALRRLWIVATCRHKDAKICLHFMVGQKMAFCTRCGLMIFTQVGNEYAEFEGHSNLGNVNLVEDRGRSGGEFSLN